MAWLNPTSPPYEISTIFRTIGDNLGSNKSDFCKSFLNSALPAKINPFTFGMLFVINDFVNSSATFLK